MVYDALMRCGWDTLRTFAGNDRQLQGTPGAIAVLHTNTRRLDYHPHAHLLMPAAAVDEARKRWRTKRPGKGKGPTLFKRKALARVFRAKMLAAIAAAGLSLPARHPVQWVVDCKSVGAGAKALIYLARYRYGGVISENDIVACADGQVSCRYRDGNTGKTGRRTVPGADFFWLVLLHVLPKGFRRARNFGFLHPNCKRLIALPHLLLKFVPTSAQAWVKPRAPILCSCCGTVMTIVRTRIRSVFPAPIRPTAEGAC